MPDAKSRPSASREAASATEITSPRRVSPPELITQLERILDQLPPDSGAAVLREGIRRLGSMLDDSNSMRKRYIGLINALPDAVSLLDPAGRILDANEAACRVFGREREELLRMSVHDLNPGLEPDRMEQITRTHELGQTFTVQTTNVRGDGSVFPVEVHSALFLDRGEHRVIAIARDMSQRVEAESNLRASEARYRQLLQAMDKGVLVQAHDGRIISVNPAACRILGMCESELLDPQFDFSRWRAIDENGESLRISQTAGFLALREGRTVDSTVIGVFAPQRDHYVWLSVTSVPQFEPEAERPFQVISTFSDITELKRDSALFSQTQALANIGGWEWDPKLPHMYLTGQLRRILHRGAGDQVTFDRFIDHVEPRDRTRVRMLMHDALNLGSNLEIECRIRTARDEPRWVRLLGGGILGDGNPVRVFGTLQDITEEREQQEKMRRLALTDPTTGLANRDAAMEEIALALEHAGPERGPALLYIDLDRFKVINDLLGHAAGDALLAAAGARLQESVGEHGIVARFGGDEFVVLLPQTLRGLAPMALAEHIANGFSRSFEFEGEELTLTASIGVARYPDDGVTVRQLVNNADAAMSDAKRRGRNSWQRFNPALAQKQSERLLIETQLRRALGAREFSLAYQPVVDMRSGRVQSAEALLRWNNRVLGEMPPDRFIPHAEVSGDIVRIGAWVIREACRQLRAWRSAGLQLPRVAVNASFRQFLSEDFSQMVVAALREFELDGNSLEIEITERVLIDDAPDTFATLTALKELGVIITIDDFGEGYSALNYLRRLPIDGLKISHNFMRNVPGNQSDAEICVAIIRIAQSLGLKVIAEGVESALQRDFLLELGTDRCQGFLYSKPLLPDDFARYIQRHAHHPA